MVNVVQLKLFGPREFICNHLSLRLPSDCLVSPLALSAHVVESLYVNSLRGGVIAAAEIARVAYSRGRARAVGLLQVRSPQTAKPSRPSRTDDNVFSSNPAQNFVRCSLS
jgi:hypothetical protein